MSQAELTSTNYRRIAAEDVEKIAQEYDAAWKQPFLPIRQHEMAVRHELKHFAAGGSVAPFDVMRKCLMQLPTSLFNERPTLLDVGCSSGLYREVIRMCSYPIAYTGVDYSKSFIEFGRSLWPDIDIDYADARNLPFDDDQFDIVLSGGTMMHIREYDKVVAEFARVASRFIILHRTSIAKEGPTQFWIKDAYGIPVLEIHFSESELNDLFRVNNLKVIAQMDFQINSRSYVLAVQ